MNVLTEHYDNGVLQVSEVCNIRNNDTNTPGKFIKHDGYKFSSIYSN